MQRLLLIILFLIVLPAGGQTSGPNISGDSFKLHAETQGSAPVLGPRKGARFDDSMLSAFPNSEVWFPIPPRVAGVWRALPERMIFDHYHGINSRVAVPPVVETWGTILDARGRAWQRIHVPVVESSDTPFGVEKTITYRIFNIASYPTFLSYFASSLVARIDRQSGVILDVHPLEQSIYIHEDHPNQLMKLDHYSPTSAYGADGTDAHQGYRRVAGLEGIKCTDPQVLSSFERYLILQGHSELMP